MNMRILAIMIASIFAVSHKAQAQVDNPYAGITSGRPMELKPAAADDDVAALLKRSFNATHKEMRFRHNYWMQDIGGINALIDSAQRLHQICVQINPDKELQLVESKLTFAKELEKQCEEGVSKARFAALREINEVSAQAFRIATELELAKLKSAASSAKSGEKAK